MSSTFVGKRTFKKGGLFISSFVFNNLAFTYVFQFGFVTGF